MKENSRTIVFDDGYQCAVGAFESGKKYWWRGSEEVDGIIHVMVIESEYIASFKHGIFKIISEMYEKEGSSTLAKTIVEMGLDRLLLSDSGRNEFTAYSCDFKAPTDDDLQEFGRYLKNGIGFKVIDKKI